MIRASSMISALCLLGCGASLVAVQDEGPVLIEHQPGQEVRDAVVRALLLRRYTAESEQPGRIMALYRRGEIEFRMLIEYSETGYHVSYAGSSGLAFGVDEETGEPLVDSRIVRWRRGLSIQQELARPERERREAAQAQRRHDLAVATEQRRQAEAERDRANAQARPAQPPQPGAPNALVILQQVPSVVGAGGGVNLQHHRQRGSSEQSLHCCVNGAYYSCPGQAAFESCMSLGPNECTRDPGQDGSC
jgi:hypothetical protein